MSNSARTQGSWRDETIVVDGLDLLSRISTSDDAESASLPMLIEIACRRALANIGQKAEMFDVVTLPIGDDAGCYLYEVIACIGEQHYQRFEVRVRADELVAWSVLMERKEGLLYGLIQELNALTPSTVAAKTDYFRPLFEIKVLDGDRPFPTWASGPIWASDSNILKTVRECREFLTARARKALEGSSEVA